MPKGPEAPKIGKVSEAEALNFLLHGPSGDPRADARVAAAILKTEQKRAPNYEPVFKTGIYAKGLERVDVFSGKPLKSYS